MTNCSLERSNWPLLLGGCLCAAAYLLLALDSQSYGMAQLPEFLLICTGTGLVIGAIWLAHRYQNLPISALWIIGFGCIYRIIGVCTYPLFEDDFFRYLWDGRMLVELGSPYGIAPATFFSVDNLKDWETAVLSSINYPAVPTVYGPVAQWFFGFCYWLAPGSVKALQVGFALADLGVLVLLLRLANPAAAMLYAFSPLVVKEFAMSAHVDVLGVLFLLFALFAFQRERWWLVGVTLALAAGVKIFALVAAPFLLGFKWRAWVGLLAMAVVVAWPFGLITAWLPEGLSVMGSQWLFNSPLHLVLHELTFIPSHWIMPGLLLGFTLLWFSQYRRWIGRWHGDRHGLSLSASPPPMEQWPLHWLVGVFLLILPALNPWYLVWWLPFAVIKPLWTPWVASIAVLLSYASGINLGDYSPTLSLYQIPTWVLICEYAVIGLAVLIDIAQHRGWVKRH